MPQIVAVLFVLTFIIFGLILSLYRAHNRIDRLDRKLAEHLAADPRYTRQG